MFDAIMTALFLPKKKTMTIEVHLRGGSVIRVPNVTRMESHTGREHNRFVGYTIVRDDDKRTYLDICLDDISAFVEVPNK